jgi:hypothetical protein
MMAPMSDPTVTLTLLERVLMSSPFVFAAGRRVLGAEGERRIRCVGSPIQEIPYARRSLDHGAQTSHVMVARTPLLSFA